MKVLYLDELLRFQKACRLHQMMLSFLCSALLIQRAPFLEQLCASVEFHPSWVFVET